MDHKNNTQPNDQCDARSVNSMFVGGIRNEMLHVRGTGGYCFSILWMICFVTDARVLEVLIGWRICSHENVYMYDILDARNPIQPSIMTI